MNESIEALWAPHIESIAACCRDASRVVAYLHLPKTGGKAIRDAMNRSETWVPVFIPAGYLEASVCTCRRVGCEALEMSNATLRFRAADVGGRGVFLQFNHETYASVRWLLDRLADHGVSAQLLACVRPVRRRLVSMFTDYWTQVFTADRYLSGEIDLSPHREAVVMTYHADAVHYREGRTIDGERWFRAFATHGGGVPFLLPEVFGDPTDLASVLDTGALRVFPTGHLDALMEILGGDVQVQPRRVSVTPSSVLAAAIDGAREVIDEIVARELPWDRVIAAHLGDEGFAE